MKKILLSLVLCAVASAVFMSNQSGAAASGPGDRTGRVTPTNTCRGCHSGSTYGNVTVTQVVKDLMNNVVTAYTPGMTYTVTLTINSTAGTPAGYAFQWASVKLADNMTQAGTPTTAQANTSVNTLSGRKYVEQSARLATNIITFSWVAPAAGTGSVKTVFVGMGVNGNDNSGGTDTCSPSTTVTLTENVVSTNRIEMPVSTLKIMPNPVADALHLSINAAQSGNYILQIADLAGRIVTTEVAALNDGENTLKLDVNNLTSGVYLVRLLNANMVAASTTMVKK